MIFIYFILSLFIWSIYAKIEGETEAYLYHYWTRSNIFTAKDLHPLWFFKRICVAVGLNLPLLFIHPTLLGMMCFLLSLFSYGLVFSLIHNGFYYITRNDLDFQLYRERFKADSISSTAKMEFDYKTRLTFFMIGSILLTIIGIICLNQG